MKDTEMDGPLARAQRVVPVFDGNRLRALRELTGGAQADIANEAGITPSALSQAERGLSKPTAATLVQLAGVLEVPVEAFSHGPQPSRELAPQFRHLRRTQQRQRKKASRLVEATDSIVRVLASHVELPRPISFERGMDPDASVESVSDEIEIIAVETRSAIGVPTADPLDVDLVALLENHGVVVVRDPETDRDIDAYSAVVNGQPIMVLDGGSQSVWDRDNFNLAHELGHLVMHRGAGEPPGRKTLERQAHRFAGAFLAPRDAIRSEIPEDLDWNAYLDLKLRWGLSMAALIHRARDLKLINEAMYTRAMKQRSAYGWIRDEPGNQFRPLPQPALLARAVELAGMSISDVATLAGIPAAVAIRIVGAGPKPLVRV